MSNTLEPSDFPADIQIAIPAYKAERELQSFLPDLLAVVPAAQICVLIDGVFDSSQEICSRYGVETVVHEINRGKGAALMSLFTHLAPRCSWIITMDADGQHLPTNLVQFIAKIREVNSSCAIIAGFRNRRGSSMPLARRFSNWSTSRAISLITKQNIFDSQCGYRAYRSETAAAIPCQFTRFEMESEILIRASVQGYTIENVPVSTVYNGGPSHISHVKDTLRWIRAVLATMRSVHSGER